MSWYFDLGKQSNKAIVLELGSVGHLYQWNTASVCLPIDVQICLNLVGLLEIAENLWNGSCAVYRVAWNAPKTL